MKLNHGLYLDWSILLKSKLNFIYKSFCKAKNPHTIKIMKDSSKHTINLYLQYLGRQKILLQTILLLLLTMTTKNLETSMADHKGDNKHEKQI